MKVSTIESKNAVDISDLTQEDYTEIYAKFEEIYESILKDLVISNDI